jgi:ABC-type uncharacterized transport system fused permease/ATPase subunit
MVEYLNLPTDTSHRMVHYENTVKLFREDLDKIEKVKRWPECDPVDLACIELRGLSFKYKNKGAIGAYLSESSASLVQGGLYALVGPPSQGKGTILKLFGDVLIPFYPSFDRNCSGGGGNLLIPTHLRALHVSKDPLFLEGTLRFNLTFGCGKKTDDHNLTRVVTILERLHVPKHLIDTVKSEDSEAYEWGQLLSSTDSALLHIARALITNPEILCIHKPALFLNTQMSENVYNVLKEFVTHRGLEQDPKEFYHRRPRTCIVTARRVEGPAAAVADAAFHVTQAEGVKKAT